MSTGTPSQWPMMDASKNLALLCSVTILGCPHSQEWALSLPLHPDLVLSPPRCPSTSISLCLFPAKPPWTPGTRQCPPSLPMSVPHSDFHDTHSIPLVILQGHSDLPSSDLIVPSGHWLFLVPLMDTSQGVGTSHERGPGEVETHCSQSLLHCPPGLGGEL